MIEVRETLFKSEHMFTTGDNPLLVTCTDFSDWVCKHGRLSASTLFNEMMGSNFARVWGLRTPPICLINVANSHLPDAHLNIIQPAFFQKPCFGSFYLKNSQVVDNTLLPSFRKSSFRKKIANRSDLLKIGLFDIWLGNEDRHRGNSNLLLDQREPNHYYFNVFDHGAIFNSNALHYGLELITEYESIICTELTKILFSKIRSLTQIVDNIVEEFYLCIENCEQELDNILQDIPLQWGLNLVNLEELLRANLFDPERNKNCENHFRALIQASI
tara:strand:- start:890 stop:1708 length:819 start_codon:yes stop_codon:yes gene_type:complete